MWDAIKQMLGSKKALAMFLSVVFWVAGKAGLSLDAGELLPVVAPIWMYILGQGIADAGKEAEKVAEKVALTAPPAEAE